MGWVSGTAVTAAGSGSWTRMRACSSLAGAVLMRVAGRGNRWAPAPLRRLHARFGIAD